LLRSISSFALPVGQLLRILFAMHTIGDMAQALNRSPVYLTESCGLAALGMVQIVAELTRLTTTTVT